MANLLTRGAIADITEGGNPEGPVLQVLSLKRVPSPTHERYRLLVSDGQWSSSFAMLNTQYNVQVTSGEISLHCIIRVNRFVCSTVQIAKKVLIIMDLEVLKSGTDVGQRIGDPKLYDMNKNKSLLAKTPPEPVGRPLTSDQRYTQNGAASTAHTSSPIPPTSSENNSSLIIPPPDPGDQPLPSDKINQHNKPHLAASSACTLAPTPAYQPPPSTNQVTRGVIADIFDGGKPDRTVLQILNFKLIPSGTCDRYRILVSDGQWSSNYAMLDSELNGKIVSGEVNQNCIIQVNRFVCSIVQIDKKVLSIMDLEVLQSGVDVGQRIGDPEPYDKKKYNSSVTTLPPKPDNQPSTSAQHYTPNLAASSAYATPPTQAHQSTPSPKRYKPNEAASSAITLPPTPAYQSPPSAQHFTQNIASSPVHTPPPEPANQQTPLLQRYPPNVASLTTHTQRGPRFRPIESLCPYQNKWTIRARVSTKSDVKTWSNSRGQGKLFSVEFLDESGEIRATGFNEELDKFYNFLEVNKVYFVRNATIKEADKKYNELNKDYEMTFNKMTEIALCEDDNSVPEIQFAFLPISEISNTEKDTLVDVIGVCKGVSDVQMITARATGRELTKRDVQLMDNSNTEITLTLWGAQAENFDGSQHPIVAIKRVKVREFNGKILSMLNSSLMQINPDIGAAHRLRNWFKHGGSQQDFTNISSQMGITGTGCIGNSFKTFAEAKLESLGGRDEPDYYDVNASVVMLKKENCLYTACPSETCNKKVIDTINGLYRCEKCNREYDSFKWRFMLSCNLADATDSNWVTCFGIQAEILMGITAQQLGEMRETNYENFENAFKDANFKAFKIRLKVKTDIFNGETRLRTTVLALAPLDPPAYNKQLISEIKQMAEEAFLNQAEPWEHSNLS